MIVATIGNAGYIIKSLDDANALLGILSRATAFGERYSDDYRETWRVELDKPSVSVEISNDFPVLTEAEYENKKHAHAALTVVTPEAA